MYDVGDGAPGEVFIRWGKTVRGAGKARTLMFEWALQAAMSEHDKPIEYRLDWNHEEDPFVVSPQSSASSVVE